MIVISLTNAPSQLRGYLTRYLSEVQSGLFVGQCSARVRDSLWERVKKSLPERGRAVLVHNGDNEQGYRVEYHNFPNRTMVWLDGLDIPATIELDDDGIPSRHHNDDGSGGSHWSKAYWRRRKSRS